MANAQKSNEVIVMDWFVSPPNSCVEAPTPTVTVFGDKAFKEVNEVLGPHPVWLVSFKEKEETPGIWMHKEKAMWGHEKMAIHKPRREVSGETKPADILILDF